jgi:hypothetical protein
MIYLDECSCHIYKRIYYIFCHNLSKNTIETCPNFQYFVKYNINYAKKSEALAPLSSQIYYFVFYLSHEAAY